MSMDTASTRPEPSARTGSAASASSGRSIRACLVDRVGGCAGLDRQAVRHQAAARVPPPEDPAERRAPFEFEARIRLAAAPPEPGPLPRIRQGSLMPRHLHRDGLLPRPAPELAVLEAAGLSVAPDEAPHDHQSVGCSAWHTCTTRAGFTRDRQAREPDGDQVGRGPGDRLHDHAGGPSAASGRLFEKKMKARQGTASYMGRPEQIPGYMAMPMVAADVYSFGCTCYELACGRPPFRGQLDEPACWASTVPRAAGARLRCTTRT